MLIHPKAPPIEDNFLSVCIRLYWVFSKREHLCSRLARLIKQARWISMYHPLPKLRNRWVLTLRDGQLLTRIGVDHLSSR